MESRCHTPPLRRLGGANASPGWILVTFHVATAFLLCLSSSALAVNTLEVPSLEVITNTQGVAIPIRMVNDTALMGVVTPLVIRNTSGGAFITSVKGSFRDRLPPGGPLSDFVFVNHYTSENGNCKSDEPGGFGAPSVIADTNSQPVSASPYAILFVRFSTVSPILYAGADESGSLLLTVDIGDQDGTFEIDTTCIDPTNHLFWVEVGPFIKEGIPATFTKGVVTVLACACPFQADFDEDGFSTALDLGSLIDVIFAGAPDILDRACPKTRADFDCDGFATALDLSGLVDYLFQSGNAPCDPCLLTAPEGMVPASE